MFYCPWSIQILPLLPSCRQDWRHVIKLFAVKIVNMLLCYFSKILKIVFNDDMSVIRNLIGVILFMYLRHICFFQCIRNRTLGYSIKSILNRYCPCRNLVAAGPKYT